MRRQYESTHRDGVKREYVYCLPIGVDMSAAEVGAKAANLAKARSLGAKVPSTRVLTRRALHDFLADTGLMERVHTWLAHGPAERRADRARVFSALSRDARAAPVPEPIHRDASGPIQELLATAPAGLAVRSSGIHEDSGKASFAGVYDSFLCVSSIDEVWHAVRRCWCSAWSPQAVDYARKMGLELEPDSMAVIVQQVVPAECAGVIFTADPQTGDPWRFVINSTFGLAQDLVGRGAPADKLVLEWDTAELVERRVADKPKALTATSDSIQEADVPVDRRTIPALADETARDLARLGLDLDRAFDARVDIEWAQRGGDVFVLQVRPITALPQFFPHDLSSADAQETWEPTMWCITVEERKPIVAPLFRDTWMSEQWQRYKPKDVTLGYLDFRERDFNGYRYTAGYNWPGLSVKLDELEEWLDENEPDLRKAWLEATEEMNAAPREVMEACARADSAADLIPALLRMRYRVSDHEALTWGPAQTLCWHCGDMLRRFVQDVAPDVSVDELLQGIHLYSHEKTEAGQALAHSVDEEVVTIAFRDHPLAEVGLWLLANHPECRFLREYEAYCRRFGVRPPSWSSRPPRWSEWNFIDPQQTLLVIKNTLSGQCRDIRVVREERVRGRTAAEARAREAIRQKDSSLIPRFDKVLGWAQFWAAVLDDRNRSYVTHVGWLELAWQTGVRLQREGLLDAPEDILLLAADDLRRIADAQDVRQYRELYSERKGWFERNRRLSPPPYLGAPPKSEETTEPSQQTPPAQRVSGEVDRVVLKGTGVTPGRANGIARVAADLRADDLLDSLRGEHVLVCTKGSFDCDNDWLSLLIVVRGLVCMEDQGSGDLRHALQIAREIGVPLVNLPDTDPSAIPDGVQVSLDGAEGTVSFPCRPSVRKRAD